MINLGDIKEGRPNLGAEMPVFVYRLFEMAMISVLHKEFGKEKGDKLIREAGFLAGTAFAEQIIDRSLTFNEFIAVLQNKMAEYKIGIVRIESADLDKGEVMLAVYEDLDCSGLPIADETTCVYDEGFIAGILECYTGIKFNVREVDCWTTGDRVCRFKAKSE